ncbi:hypothetical protein P4J00_23675 [Bacillus cereus]|nr:hypothetical protein [Bacillus cereus]
MPPFNTFNTDIIPLGKIINDRKKWVVFFEHLRFRAVNHYASKNGFGAVFPNFYPAYHQDGRVVVYGVVCINPEAVKQRDVPMNR